MFNIRPRAAPLILWVRCIAPTHIIRRAREDCRGGIIHKRIRPQSGHHRPNTGKRLSIHQHISNIVTTWPNARAWNIRDFDRTAQINQYRRNTQHRRHTRLFQIIQIRHIPFTQTLLSIFFGTFSALTITIRPTHHPTAGKWLPVGFFPTICTTVPRYRNIISQIMAICRRVPTFLPLDQQNRRIRATCQIIQTIQRQRLKHTTIPPFLLALAILAPCKRQVFLMPVSTYKTLDNHQRTALLVTINCLPVNPLIPSAEFKRRRTTQKAQFRLIHRHNRRPRFPRPTRFTIVRRTIPKNTLHRFKATDIQPFGHSTKRIALIAMRKQISIKADQIPAGIISRIISPCARMRIHRK